MAGQDEDMDARLLETYIPAFFMIMKTIAVLGFIPFAGWLGMSNEHVFNLIGTLLFVDRVLFNVEVQGGIDSNMSVACVLLCFVINTERVRTAYVDTALDIVLNVTWCLLALFLLVKDELPLGHHWMMSVLPSPDILIGAGMFYVHTLLPLSSASVLELSIRAIVFQCLSVSWFYTFRMRVRDALDTPFTLCISRFFPVMFVGPIVACVFAGMVWVCIMVKFYRQQGEFRAYFSQGDRRRKTPTPDPIETPILHTQGRQRSQASHSGGYMLDSHMPIPYESVEDAEDDEDTRLLREMLQRGREGVESGLV